MMPRCHGEVDTREPEGRGFNAPKGAAGYRVDGYWAMKEPICPPARGCSLRTLRKNLWIWEIFVALTVR